MKNIYKIALAILLALPTVTFAVPVSVDRLNGNHIEPLIKTDYIKASYLVASSTTATSTFANGIDISGGCFAIAGTCLGGGSSQWTTNGSNIYYNTGNVGIGSTTPISQLTIQKTIGSDVDYPALALSRDDIGNTLGDSLGDIDFWSNDASTDGPGIGSRIRGVVDDVAGRSYGLSLWTRSGGAGTPISEKMRITSTGNVGIGTTTPAARLDVAGTIAQDSPIARFSFGGTWNDEMRIVPGGANGTNPSLRLYRTTGVGLNYNPYEMKLVAGGSLQFNTGSSAAKGSESYTTNTMTLSAAGNIGIGTTSPYMNLSVVGRTKLGYHTLCGDSQPLASSTGSVLLECWGNSAYNVEMGVGNRSNANTAYTDIFLNNDLADSSITHYGSIYLNSSTYNDATYGTGQAFPNQMGIQNTDGLLSLFSSTSTASRNGINFYVGGTNTTNEIARITTAGLGVGSSTPYAKLSVTNTGTAPTALFEDSASPDTTPFIIDNSGNVGIGTSSPGALLDIYRGDLTTGHNQLDVRGQTSADYAANSVAEGVNLRIQNYYTNNYGTAGIIFNPYSNVSGSARIAGISSPGGDVSLAFQTSNNQTIAEAMRIDNIGNVGIGTTTPNTTLNLYGGGLGVNPGATGKPTCAVDRRGTYWHTFGGAGVQDNVEVCAKDSGDAYAWRTLY